MQKLLIKRNPPFYFTMLLVLDILYYLLPIPILFKGNYYNAIALVLVFIGMILNLYTSGMFGKYKTTILPTKNPTIFIQTGPFKISRNPIYLGMLLMLLGLAILSGSILLFISPIILFLILNFVFIPTEEKNLAKQFGTSYQNYKDKVRRWI